MRRETDGFELASTITLVLQANRLTNTFSEATVRRCFSKQLFLKISQYFELKRDSNRGVFSVNTANFLTTIFFYRTPPLAASAFFQKKLNSYFAKMFCKIFAILQKFLCYDVKFFSSQHVLDTCLK